MSVAAVRPSAAEAERIARAKAALADGPAGITVLVRQLDDPSWLVRRTVVELLAREGELASPALLDVLQHSRSHEARVAAVVDALSATPAPIDPELIALLHHADTAVVADAVAVLGRRRSRAALPELRELVRGEDDNVAVAAIEALGRIGGRAAVEALVAAVRSGRFFRTFPAIDVLGRTGDPRAIAPLAELLEDSAYVHEAARAMGHTGDPGAIAPLLELAKRPGEALVRIAATALAELRERYAALYGNADAIDLLIRDRAASSIARRLTMALRTSAPPEQAAIVRILGALGSNEIAPSLLALLDGPEIVARAAADVLKRLGNAGASSLAVALRDGDSARRRLVLEVLQPRSVSADDVLVALGDPDGTVRARACELLGRIGQLVAVPALFEVLADPNARVAHAALGAIQALGGDITEQLGLAAARSDDPRLRRQAYRLLGYFGPASAVPVLVAGLSDSDATLRELALQSLGNIEEPDAQAAVIAAARGDEPRLRAAAMRTLAHADVAVAAPLLLDALDDPDAWTRYYACQALGRLRHEPAAAALSFRLADPAGQVRVAAIEAMSQLSSSIATAHLLEAARSNDHDIRRACLMGMALTRRPEWLAIVIEAAGSDDSATRLVACSALAAFDDPKVPARLGELASGDDDESVRLAAMSALGELSGSAAVGALVRLLEHPDTHARASELIANRVAGRVEGILEALERTDDETAAVLTSALARMRTPAATAALMSALDLGNPAARRAAAITAAALGTNTFVEALRVRLVNDPDPEVRRVIASALQN